jgi:DnaJ family protein C protein 2
MATVVTLPLTLSAAPSGHSAPSKGKISSPVKLPVYPAGPSYISAAKRHLLQRSFAEDDEELALEREAAAAKAREEANGEPYPGLGEEVEHKDLLASDPKEWKKQDHYAILGLGHLRYMANDEQIRIARELRVFLRVAMAGLRCFGAPALRCSERSSCRVKSNRADLSQTAERCSVTTRTRRPARTGAPAAGRPTTMRSSSASRRVSGGHFTRSKSHRCPLIVLYFLLLHGLYFALFKLRCAIACC